MYLGTEETESTFSADIIDTRPVCSSVACLFYNSLSFSNDTFKEEEFLEVDEVDIGRYYKVAIQGLLPRFLDSIDNLIDRHVKLAQIHKSIECYEVIFRERTYLVPFGCLKGSKTAVDSYATESASQFLSIPDLRFEVTKIDRLNFPHYLKPIDDLIGKEVHTVGLIHSLNLYHVQCDEQTYLVPPASLREVSPEPRKVFEQFSERAFDYFLTVEIVEQQSGALAPVIDFLYATVPEDAHVLEEAPFFCFPDLSLIADNPSAIYSHRTEWERFTFILTKQSGKRLYGFCSRLVRPTNHEHPYPSCLCLITEYSSDFSQQILDALILRHMLFPDTLLKAAREFAKSSPPEDGTSIDISISDNDVIRLYSHPVCNINLEPLFKYLSIDNILFIVSFILTERRIIFHSTKLQKISTCIHSFLKIIHPFEWQHICIPILPERMIHLLGAPMPLIVGLQTFQVENMTQIALEHILIDIDNDSILSAQAFTPFPPKFERKLHSLISKLTAPKILDPDTKEEMFWGFESDAILASFIAFYIHLVGHWRKYILSERKISFAEDSSTPTFRRRKSAHEAFLDMLRQSQLFQAYLEKMSSRGEESYSRYDHLMEVAFQFENNFTDCFEYVRGIDGSKRGAFYTHGNVKTFVDAMTRICFQHQETILEPLLHAIIEVVRDPRVLSILLYIVDERLQRHRKPSCSASQLYPTLEMCIHLCDRGEYLFATQLMQRLHCINFLRYFESKADQEGSKRVQTAAETLYRMLTNPYLLEKTFSKRLSFAD